MPQRREPTSKSRCHEDGQPQRAADAPISIVLLRLHRAGAPLTLVVGRRISAMGYSVAWLAFRGIPREKVLAVACFADTMEPDAYHESPVSGITISGGWYVVYLNDCFHPLTKRETLNRLSIGCEVLGCQIEEHIMASASFFYANGRRTWNVVHDCEAGVYDLQIEGEPPDILEEIQARLVAKRDAEGGEEADVDLIFDIPIELAATLSGFRHDQPGEPAGRPGSTTLMPMNA